MAGEIVMPKLGLTMTEGLVAEWKVAPGDRVRAGDVLFVVETDKIATEIQAETGGEIAELLVPAGSTVAVGTPVARWRSTSEARGDTPADPPPPAGGDESPAGGHRVLATPLARRLARERGIALSTLRGSGARGRIKARDVPPRPTPTVAEEARLIGAAPRPPERVRLMVAERLSQAKREIPHFYVGAAADVTRLLALREEWQAIAGATRFTVTHAILLACGRALLEEPALNRIWTDEGWLGLAGSAVGLAVETPRGLFAPVLRDVGRMSLEHLARAAAGLVERARAGLLTQDDMAPASLTVSNVGMHGARFLVPIINPGQAMILGIGASEAVFRPDASGAPRLRHEITLVLAADHRVLDGAEAARFLARIVRHLEQPLALLRTPAQEEP
jgi:pyruvate dehydrogenase E2 component (dihydrolipoamide acetyltransferase)